MGGRVCREKVKEEKRRSPGREDSLSSADKIQRFSKQSGHNVLSLARRGLKDAPGELWELQELEKLNLSLNNLKALPPQLGLLSNLLVLNLWGNQLSSLPAEIGQLRRLRVLFVYRNRLTEVPEELGACTQLEVLSLANNQLSSLPASLSNLTRLRKLNLSHNLMAHLPGCIYSMKALVFLDLSCNRLENVAENIQALLELKILIMEGNQLQCLPRGLCFLIRLELLNLDFNHIRDLPEPPLQPLPSTNSPSEPHPGTWTLDRFKDPCKESVARETAVPEPDRTSSSSSKITPFTSENSFVLHTSNSPSFPHHPRSADDPGSHRQDQNHTAANFRDAPSVPPAEAGLPSSG
ncbi:leucine-rich repeat-containing protein 30-like isoform X1 [Xiphophorus couchianus]|uniref:leucine-rich repeat-containing protein 30-like isoform X1 n=1 Tax=Xiphophorus couchianus TaxID=32473 RepID=UPI0010160547|nr:leucine-rich repeat-containing protein 30-like isoform X1 [Xiphophorus couchianus]XP_027861142.1 leucine-rich repeat-containing protein 30-like isoform X1 [Xiphophorus couchianus]XP_027861150.1 leucine-rich repeat-containing protein 30-like isoform X1 [Xiphophorus couchianus]XP_027861151.1 leucine-rich repeat-containing protein 30-like isoform X1 [Xiphophorus couchianus]